MTGKPRTEAAAAAALKRALSVSNEMTCEQARALLPALVEAERAGVDVGKEPAFTALLRHLDESPECAEIYAALADQLEALEGRAEQFAPVNVTPPNFFDPIPQSDNVVLRVWKGLKTRFGLTIDLPQFGPPIATMGAGTSLQLFSGTLEAGDRAAEAEVVLYPHGDPPELVVAVREQRATGDWQIQLQLGDRFYTAQTNDHGEARLSGFSEDQLRAAGHLDLLYIPISDDEL